MSVWAFAKVTDDAMRQRVYASLKAGVSRFGWSSNDEDDLRVNRQGKQAFLLNVNAGDWVVHVNCPEQGRCAAAQVGGSYTFDDGLPTENNRDFRHALPVDPATVIEFDRRDPKVLPTVNLRPLRRAQRVYAEEDFFKSLDNLRDSNFHIPPEFADVYHLRGKVEPFLKSITEQIQATHKSHTLEPFIAKVFERMPNVVAPVKVNDLGWGTDYGADLIANFTTEVGPLRFDNTVVVQVKSFTQNRNDTKAVDQVVTAIRKYDAQAGLIITTAASTPVLEQAIEAARQEVNVPIELIAGEDVARLVLKHWPEALFDLEVKDAAGA